MNELVRDECRRLLMHHNFALRRVTLFFGRELDNNEAPIRLLAEQSRPVRRVHDPLKGATYQFEQDSKLWPIVLGGVMSRFPTLLYRFLRQGNVLGLAAVWSGTADLSLPSSRSRAGRTWCYIR
jgi:hypothetical protein